MALRLVAQAQGMGAVAVRAGIQRDSLYRALSPKGNPTLKTLLVILAGANDHGGEAAQDDETGRTCSAGFMASSLFAEIAEGFEALAEARASKRTLRTHEVEAMPAPDVTAEELIALCERLNLSRPVLARYLTRHDRSPTFSLAPAK